MKTKNIVLLLGAFALLMASGYGLYRLNLAHSAKRVVSQQAVATAAAKNGSAPVHHGDGRVEYISAGTITISHGPIPSLQWEPMIMDFKLPSDGVLKNIEIGDIVGFEFRRTTPDEFEIVGITRLTPAPPQEHQHDHDHDHLH